MKDAGILDGDHVVVRRQDTATNGDIVVALVGERGHGQALLQGIRPRPAPARERRRWSPSAAADVTVLGKVVGVLRRVT